MMYSLKKGYTIFVLLLLSGQLLAQKVVLKQLNNKWSITWNNKQRLIGGIGLIQDKPSTYPVRTTVRDDVAIFSLETKGDTIKGEEFGGVFFQNIPDLKHGITLWRYKPWNSWTKPVRLSDATKMSDWDVQFFYWQYQDGTYGAAVPVSGKGFRTTLGSQINLWGSKAVSYASNNNIATVPGMAVAFGTSPFELFDRIYRVALHEMGADENQQRKKTMPQPLQHIGWCTWNASNNGKDLNEEHIIAGVKTFTDHKFPLGWLLIDDGWFQQKNNQLTSLQPNSEKFPNGFRPVIQRLKKEYGVKYAGIWHAFNGYWNGIDPESELGRHYKSEMFSWTQKERPDVETAALKTYSFIRPNSDSLYSFYNTWHRYFKKEGFDFIKVDNQLVTERMAVNTYPLFELSKSMHRSLYKSVDQNFNGAVINCMDMTADAYFNFGTSAVARAVEDYFPYKPGETYDLQKGNAAAHVLQAVYNAIYFSQMVYPDFDMFQSHHPNAVYHAIARTLNNGPVYLTDVPGKQDFNILDKIVYKDGKSIRASSSLMPTEDCLFQLQDAKTLKTFSRAGDAGLLGLFNAADANSVQGRFKAADVDGIKGNRFVLYEYFSGNTHVADRNTSFEITLSRLGYELVYVLPMNNGFAAFGLINKYNAPATIMSQTWKNNSVSVRLYEGGLFEAYSSKKPTSVRVNGIKKTFSFKNELLKIQVAEPKPLIEIKW